MAQEKSQKKPVICAAGGIIFRSTAGGGEVLIIHRARYNDWCLPKGKLEEGESFKDAAVREVKEETGYDVSITGFAGAVSYEVGQKQKVVQFWNMEVKGESNFKASEEVEEIRWMDVNGALKILDYPKEKELLKKIHGKPGNVV